MPKNGSKNKKAKPVLWSDQARKDLERIFDHIAENFSVDLATNRIEQIITEIEDLSRFPRKGAISKRFNEIRELVVEANTVYYRNNELDVVIASIRPRKTAPKEKL